jgi:hypothetical protein
MNPISAIISNSATGRMMSQGRSDIFFSIPIDLDPKFRNIHFIGWGLAPPGMGETQMDILTEETAKSYVVRMMHDHVARAVAIDSVTLDGIDGAPVYLVRGSYADNGETIPFRWDVWLETNGKIYGEW